MAGLVLVPSSWTAGFGSTELNSLANNSQDSSSLTAPQIDNSGGTASYVQFEVTLGALSPTAGATIIAFLIPETITAGIYVTGGDSATANDQARWQNGPNAIIALRLTASTAQTQRSNMIPIGPERYKVALINRAGVALAASGNQLYWRTIAETVV